LRQFRRSETVCAFAPSEKSRCTFEEKAKREGKKRALCQGIFCVALKGSDGGLDFIARRLEKGCVGECLMEGSRGGGGQRYDYLKSPK